MRFIAAALLGCLLAIPVTWATADPSKQKKDELVCVSNTELDKALVEKGYDVLLAMTNENGVVESVWAEIGRAHV